MTESSAHPRRQFSIDEIQRMVEIGILREDEPLELIAGELLVVHPQGPSHRSLTVRVHRALESAYGAGFHVQDHSPIAISPRSMPEPDIAVIRGDVDAYMECLPEPKDVMLCIEIAVTTLANDRRKAQIYAEGGVEHYWLVNVEERRLEAHASPRDGGYATVTSLADTETLTVPGTASQIGVADFLP